MSLTDRWPLSLAGKVESSVLRRSSIGFHSSTFTGAELDKDGVRMRMGARGV